VRQALALAEYPALAESAPDAFPADVIEVAREMLRGMGHADAVPLGDYHLPRIVAFHLTGEARGDDGRMLELLEPWRGQRGRIVRWILDTGRMPPRRGPRMGMRDVDPAGRALVRGLR
jgi:hypothetical protein